MSVGPAVRVPASTEAQLEAAEVRPAAPVIPGSGEDSYGKTVEPQDNPKVTADPQDEVKVQFEPPGEVAVYRFVTHDGSLIVQVPSEQMLSIAREISQALEQEAAPKNRS